MRAPGKPTPHSAYRLDQKESLIRSHLPLVRRIAGHLASRLPPSIELDDLMQFGLIGLNDAIQRYQAQDGVPFEVYARMRIRGSMIDGLRQTDLLPRHVRDRIRDLEECVRRLSHELGRQPEDGEIATAMAMTLDEYRALLTDAVSIQYGNDDDEGSANHEDLLAEEETPQSLMERRDEERQLAGLLRQLPEREAMVMSLHYQEGLTFREVAKVLDLTPGRISQIHTQAILRLRALAKESDFRS
jgi:RNA polymerase sigma factor for flagellar operon FliA